MAAQECLQEFVQLDAVARDASGKEVSRLVLVLGQAALCYPPGAKLCIDTPTYPSDMVVVTGLEDSGGQRSAPWVADGSPMGRMGQALCGSSRSSYRPEARRGA